MRRVESSTITSKGQIVIPARLRRRLRIRTGTRVSIREDQGRLILQPITREYIDSLKGCLKPKGKESMLDTLLKERRRERDL